MDMNEWFALQQKGVASKLKKNAEAARRAQSGGAAATVRAGMTAAYDTLEAELLKLLNEVVSRRASYDDLARFENNCCQYIIKVSKGLEPELLACGDPELLAEKEERERSLIVKLHSELLSQQKFVKSRTFKMLSDVFKKKK